MSSIKKSEFTQRGLRADQIVHSSRSHEELEGDLMVVSKPAEGGIEDTRAYRTSSVGVVGATDSMKGFKGNS